MTPQVQFNDWIPFRYPSRFALSSRIWVFPLRWRRQKMLFVHVLWESYVAIGISHALLLCFDIKVCNFSCKAHVHLWQSLGLSNTLVCPQALVNSGSHQFTTASCQPYLTAGKIYQNTAISKWKESKYIICKRVAAGKARVTVSMRHSLASHLNVWNRLSPHGRRERASICSWVQIQINSSVFVLGSWDQLDFGPSFNLQATCGLLDHI